MYDSRGNASCRYALPWDVILPWFGFSPYSALSFNATSKPEVTSPIGEKPCRSKKPLSPKLMNICDVRVFGPAVALLGRGEQKLQIKASNFEARPQERLNQTGVA